MGETDSLDDPPFHHLHVSYSASSPGKPFNAPFLHLSNFCVVEMPTLERRTLPHSLSVVANKGRRLFSRDLAPTPGLQSRSPTPLRASALNLNEVLEQNWSSTSSPFCLSNQLDSPQPSVSSQSQSWGSEFGRRRSSNTTTTSASSAGTTVQEGQQRRRKSLFSKKARTAAPSISVNGDEARFVDPFARHTGPKVKAEAETVGASSSRAGSQRLSWQQQKQEALDRVSNLVCLSVQNQMQVPRSQVGATSPTFLTPSPTLCDSYFYPVEAPPSPTSPAGSLGSRASIIAFPSLDGLDRSFRSARGSVFSAASPSLSTMSTKVDVALQDEEADLSRETPAKGASQILLPSAMKRLSSREGTFDADKRSSASLKAQVGHDSQAIPASRQMSRMSSIYQHPSDWSLFEESRPSLQPPPPLRPSRNPLRSRSKSLSAAMSASPKGDSPPPPLPSPPTPPAPSKMEANGMVAAYNLTPVHTPPRSRRSSGCRRHGARCDSFASVASSGSVSAAPFHTPTFGACRWSTSPVV